MSRIHWNEELLNRCLSEDKLPSEIMNEKQATALPTESIFENIIKPKLMGGQPPEVPNG